jgi:hypothetical protein
MMGRGISLFLVLCAGASADAQQATFQHPFTTIEVLAGTTTPVANPNGLIEPGEGVLFELNLGFTPPVGTIVPWGTGTAEIAGLGDFQFTFRPTVGTAEGFWSHLQIAAGWSGEPGQVGNLGVWHVMIWQFPQGASLANPQNPIPAAWRGVWTPGSYEPRIMEWRPQLSGVAGWGEILARTGTDPQGHPIYARVTATVATNPAYTVSIVPSPGMAGLLLAAPAVMLRRPRRDRRQSACHTARRGRLAP